MAISAHLRPRKSLGQNFLRDDNIARRIVRAIDPRPDECVLEIGPGEGALTRHLLPRAGHLIVVEIDRRAVERLRAEFPAAAVEVLHKDVRDVNLGRIAADRGARVRVVGNIPYNITSPIIFHVLDHRASVTDCTIMVQKEVAGRLNARVGTKEYGIVAVFAQLFADVKRLFDVSPNAFVPKPKVMSSVVQLRMLPEPRYALRHEAFFRTMVRSVFGKRRKTLRGSLRYFDKRISPAMLPEFDLQRRPEQLPIEELVALGNSLYEHLAG